MHTFIPTSRRRALLVITFASLALTSRAQKLDTAPPLELTTIKPIPATYTVPKACFTPVLTNEIYNQGCGISSRKSCCPPGFATDVIYDSQTATRSRELSPEGCPSGYIADPQWWGVTGMPILNLGVSTVVCCPSNINSWSLFEGVPLCFTRNQDKTSGTDDSSYLSTYARPFFIAVAEVEATTTPDSSTSRPRTSSETSGPGSPSSISSRSSSDSESTTSDASNTRVNISNTIVDPTATNTPPEEQPEANTKSGLGTGAIAGIVVAIVIVLFLAIGIFFFYRRKRILATTTSRKFSEPPEAPIPPPAYELDSRHVARSSGGVSETEEMTKAAELAAMDGRVHFAGRGYTENDAMEPTFQNEAKVRREVEEKRISGRGM